jgi:TetR/AcrR family transcriptional regulator
MQKNEIEKQSAESKILEAAKKLYLSKGMSNVSSRDIAEEAGLNVALLNYYFRSKEKLQVIIFSEIMHEFLLGMMEVMDGDLSLQQKVRVFIEKEYDFLTVHPEIPNFIYNELAKNGPCSMENGGFNPAIFETKVFKQIAEAQANGTMRQIELPSMILLLLGNCHIPFLAKTMVCGIHNLSSETYEEQVILHKHNITEMIISYLFINPNNTTNV